MSHILPCTPQGGNISRLYPACYSTKVYIGGIYINYIYLCVILHSNALMRMLTFRTGKDRRHTYAHTV